MSRGGVGIGSGQSEPERGGERCGGQGEGRVSRKMGIVVCVLSRLPEYARWSWLR